MRICEYCGCTDFAACLDPATGEGCYWVEEYEGDLCSVCALRLNAAIEDSQRVEIYSPLEAQRFIEASREKRCGYVD